ncbi:aldehyde dehydrogenase family protein, partial [Streptomyces sp. NPDC002130]
EAVARANDTVYGLNSSIWGRDATRARSVAARLHSGTVNINDAFAAAWGSIDSPMGGMGDSGLGRRHGIDGILKYTEAQTIAHQSRLDFYPPAGIPWNVWAPVMNIALRMWKTVGAP